MNYKNLHATARDGVIKLQLDMLGFFAQDAGMQTKSPIAVALLGEIEEFLERHAMPHTSFGRLACNDAHAVRRLREGIGLTVRRVDIYRAFMAAHDENSRGRVSTASQALRKGGEPRRSRA